MRAAVRAGAVASASAIAMTAFAGIATAEDVSGRMFPWSGERVEQFVPMEDPWVFRGPTNYRVATEPACWMYGDHQDLMVDVAVSAPDRYEPYPTDLDRLFFPVNDTVTVAWVNTTTGDRGQSVGHTSSGAVFVGVPGGDGQIELDIRLRSDQPWLQAAGSTDLPFGHSEGVVHAAADLSGKSCP